MEYRILLGHREAWPGPRVLDDALEELSASAQLHLIQGNEVVIPWELALLAQDVLDSEERAVALRCLVPSWMESGDIDFVLDAVQTCHLPPNSHLQLRLRASGRAGQQGYGFKIEWLSDGRRVRKQPVLVGGLIKTESGHERLTSGQYRLLQGIAELTNLGQSRQEDFLATGRLQSCVPAGDPGVVLDAFLKRNPVSAVEKVGPRLVPTGDGYSVRPIVDGVSDKDVDNYFYQTRLAELGRTAIRTRAAEGTSRTVFSAYAEDGLRKCRDLGSLTKEETAHALSGHAEEVFGSELDLFLFSERVTGLGPLVVTAIPSLREIKSGQWWDWDAKAELEAMGDEGALPPAIPRELDLKDDVSRRELQTAITRADEAGDSVVPIPGGGGFIAVTAQLREHIFAAEHLAQQTQRDGGKLKKRPKDVLLVKDNVETVSFQGSEIPALERIVDLGPPPGLRAPYKLHPYQEEGFAWLVSLYKQGKGAGDSWYGALLADDMGLGKTLQILAFLAWQKENAGGGPHLLVGPLGLLDNWARESAKFFGTTLNPILQVVGRSLPKDRETAAKFLSKNQIVLVSYETLRGHEMTFARVNWHTVVIDEAQKAKSPSSQVARVLRTLKARFRIAVTGTPVENTLRELWSIYDWATPGLLGSLREFISDYVGPLRGADLETKQALATELHRRIGPVFTRRLKRDVLDNLPPITFRHERIKLSREQLKAYSEISDKAGTGTPSIGLLTHLFGACAHPRLLSNDGDLPSTEKVMFPRAKRLFELVDKIARNGEKVIIFANRRKLHTWLASEITRRYRVDVEVINGSVTTSQRRMKIIDTFSETPGFGALVLSPRAAGVGLNIIAANHVIHYTREWNPALENQATDRVYRVGQTKPVSVHYFIAASEHGTTVEERLDKLLTEKREIMDRFVIPMGGFEVGANELASHEDVAVVELSTTVEPLEESSIEGVWSEVSSRRNSIEFKLRVLIHNTLVQQYGPSKATSKAMVCFTEKRRSELDLHAFADRWQHTYFRELIAVIEKNWSCFQNLFANDKAKVIGQLNDIARYRVDAHAGTLADEELNRLRDCFRTVEQVLKHVHY